MCLQSWYKLVCFLLGLNPLQEMKARLCLLLGNLQLKYIFTHWFVKTSHIDPPVSCQDNSLSDTEPKGCGLSTRCAKKMVVMS